MTIKARLNKLETKTSNREIQIVMVDHHGQPLPGQPTPKPGIIVRISEDDAKL